MKLGRSSIALFGVSIAAICSSVFAAPISKPGAEARTVYVHLFEWKWTDIALECENFLGPKGFAAVQISPPNEHAVLPGHPWLQRYQPVSYQLTSRSGTREQFIDMVRRCKAAGVDIYADVVINHMAWVNRSGQMQFGSAGSPFGEYLHPGLYQPWDFHRCGRNGDVIKEYQDRWEVQNCNIQDCADLKTSSEYVRSTLASYLNTLLDLGIAGFRVDAAKHMPAEDIQAILSRLKRPFYDFQEVIDFRSEPIRAEEYFSTGDVTEFRYGMELSRTFRHSELAWLGNFGPGWAFMPSNKAIVFVDNHDTQRNHGPGGDILNYKDGQKYVLANIFMLAWPYGYPQVMSSYRFSDSTQGPPASDRGETKDVYVGGVANCGNEWICEHRWAPIANMVQFRNYTHDSPSVSKWWTNGKNQIAFARGARGFVVLNNEKEPLDRWFETGLAPGLYCDIISSELTRNRSRCTGTTIQVNEQGWAQIRVNAYNAVAIHGGARVSAAE